ncbi:flagellin [Bradyrhizobium canariense]|uniref:Flagellin n=1 Tax=Bradyrhizobium canariense TaxID=255045 RepID=A0A1H1MFM6_9BRAD|nr:flagellin [Bradyrhizobium canariense]SDR85477.1 flagellin N-terminal helical region [Bradyrhizobium canariense]
MSGIVLSASVRQNLLSLQSTAALLATTQNDLATGNKVNSALDNPTEYFTAQGLNNRASDISNLLDGIGNGVQVLQAANTGLTSLQSLVANAQSIANQVLQAPTGYTTKSSVSSTALSGATANNLLGTNAPTSGSVTEGAFTTLNVSGAGNATAATVTGGTFANLDLSGAGASVSFKLSVDGGTAQTITLNAANVTAFKTAGGTLSGTNGTSPTALDATDVANIINYQLAGSPATGAATVTGPASVNGSGELQFTSSTTGTSSSVAITNYATAGGVTDTTGLPTANTTKNGTDGSTTAADITGTGFANLDVGTGSVQFSLNIDGASTSVDINSTTIAAFTTAGGTLAGSATALTAADVANLINWQVAGSASTGVTSPVTGPASVNGSGQLQFASLTTPGASSEVAVTGYTATGVTSGATGLSATDTTNKGTAAVAADDETFTVAVDGAAAKTISLSKASVDAYNTAHTTGTPLNAASLSAADVASLVNYQYDNTGATTIASVVGGKLTFTSGTTGTTSSIAVTAVTGTASAGSTGVTATTTPATGTAGSGLSGETLTIAATNSSTTATSITFGTGANQISTLNQLNAALAANDLQASIDSTGVITITTTNNAASDTVGAVGGTAVTTAGSPFAAVAAGGAAAVADPNSQATRASLVAQYNQVMAQINTTSQDSSFNGINLLNGDTLNLTFDETGASKLAITGVTFNDAGLGLSNLTAGTDFLDSNSANAVLGQLTQASTMLRTEASALGSNLSIVEIRQDFNKNLINVLQTGASNLTVADPNEEAANSQALSTRQSIAVSALALANQSQQSVLQLLR